MSKMSNGKYRQQLAVRVGKGDSPAMRKIFRSAMTDEEARFLLDLPTPTQELAAKYGMDQPAIEDKLLGLARRGLVIPSGGGLRFPEDLVVLHNGIMSATPQWPWNRSGPRNSFRERIS